MPVISKEEFSKATGISKVPFPGLASFLMKMMKINELNGVMEQAKSLEGVAFADYVLKVLGITIKLDERDLENIPSDGAFIAIANHPYGAVEALALFSILAARRPDTRFMGNFLLKKISNLAEYIIAVNPFENIKDTSSISGLKTTLRVLKDGSPVAVFPAGEVSAYHPGKQQITDRKWHPVVGKVISKAGVPVLPVYFEGNNGLLFSLLRFIHPSLQTAKLPSEMFNKHGHVLRVRIGKPVQPGKVPGGDNNTQLLNYLRAKTYALGTGLEHDKKLLHPASLFNVKKKPRDIIAASSSLLLEQEISTISDLLVYRERDYDVYIAPPSRIVNILKEIGRLREITFREVGEGTNNSLDLDRFDIYYYQLFIWDGKARMLVGAYRIGKGDEIFYSMGKKGFYTAELFKMKSGLFPILRQSLELGRSWIRKEYQQKPLPLFLLWKGIAKYLELNPGYRYLVGPVSISNRYSKFSKSLMVDYIMKHHFDEYLAGFIKPRKKFRVDFSKINKDALLENGNSLKDLDTLISELEMSHIKIPVLLRQYLSLNARFICFNIDPKFSDSLDGFLVLDVNDIPGGKMERLAGEGIGAKLPAL